MRILQGPPRATQPGENTARAERREGATPGSADMGKLELGGGCPQHWLKSYTHPCSRLLPFQLQRLQPVWGRGLRSGVLAEFQHKPSKNSPRNQTNPLSPPFASMRILAPHSP